MTMADTVAVMNAGRIEQLGPPEVLYECPATTFVANFLGQSNLVAGRVVGGSGGGGGGDGGDVVLDVHGTTVHADRARAVVAQGDVWVGVRPEKVVLAPAGVAPPEPAGNCLRGGVVSDVSFVGVSTQYLVRMPWGQELTAFSQNSGHHERLRTGAAVDLHWSPAHTFCLDASQDAAAGVEPEDR